MADEKKFLCVLDFEANCTDRNTRDHEILEFPMVLIDIETAKILDHFCVFVKPVKLEEVSAFITELTTITNSDLSTALSWEETLQEAEKWLKKNQVTSSNTIMVTDGNWDLNTMLPQQLSMTNTSLSPDMETLFRHWINLKLKFSSKIQEKRDGTKDQGAAGLDIMLEKLKLDLSGHHHRGIDDCMNMVKICETLMLEKGVSFKRATSHYRSGGPSQKEHWVCGKCDFSNFPSRNFCFKCDEKREDDPNLLPGDWLCEGCGNLCFARRTLCFKCGLPKP